MAEAFPSGQLAESLYDLGVGVEELLEGIDPVADYLGNQHRWFTFISAQGDSLQLAKTEDPSGRVLYSLMRELKKDDRGFVETFQYDWGNSRVECTHTKYPEHERTLGRIGPDNTYERTALNEGCLDDMEKIIMEFFLANHSQLSCNGLSYAEKS